ncbi:hypothetical protein GKZ28_07985 [Clostridium chromiireducens]|jgi:hypothetical protein|uniref:Uncharacterized protein n=1 Tax=Clostridium chromiireducens TaxID=225345 RepID=A0A964RL64_9CLOT|nr:hypothetical protein [Clostridium chromiireducens]MVX63633.1 hypothetical protein [Clostridium chromiireducens]
MLIIISKNVIVSEKDIAILSEKQAVISNVTTAFGTDDTYRAVEKLMNKVNDTETYGQAKLIPKRIKLQKISMRQLI